MPRRELSCATEAATFRPLQLKKARYSPQPHVLKTFTGSLCMASKLPWLTIHFSCLSRPPAHRRLHQDGNLDAMRH